MRLLIPRIFVCCCTHARTHARTHTRILARTLQAKQRIAITSRHDVVSVMHSAFKHFPGVVTMEGQFRRLTTIGADAFRNASWGTVHADDHPAFASYLHFGRDAFPVLVRIDSGAFKDFHGSIRFVDRPFPQLRHISIEAFRMSDSMQHGAWHELHNRVVDLSDHQALEVIDSRAFSMFPGKVLLRGDLPRLTYVGGQSKAERRSFPTEDLLEDTDGLLLLPPL